MSKSKKMVVLGAPGYIELHTLIRDINAADKDCYDVIALLDDDAGLHGSEIYGIPIAGPLSKVLEYDNDVCFALQVNNYTRRIRRMEIIRELALPHQRFPSLVHPHSSIGDYVKIGYGTQIYSFADIKNGTTFGNFCVFFDHLSTSANVTVSDGCMGGMKVTLMNGCRLAQCSFVGTGAIVMENVELGAAGMIGAHGLALSDIPPGHLALGSPINKQIKDIDLPSWILDA